MCHVSSADCRTLMEILSDGELVDEEVGHIGGGDVELKSA